MPSISGERLERIFDRTAGRCHICWGTLAFKNYARFGERGAWEIEHSNPRSKGAWNEQTRAPLSRTKRQQKHEENTWAGAGVGALSGAAVGGPIGFVIGGIAGAFLGSEIDPD